MLEQATNRHGGREMVVVVVVVVVVVWLWETSINTDLGNFF
jgi:hypothetical protein